MTKVDPAKLPVVLRSGEDGWIIAECPLIPGCVTQGENREAALANAREAIALCLEGQEEEGWELPEDYEIVDVAVAG